MKEVWFVEKDKTAKAQETLKKDELVGRQSITVRDAESLGMKKEGSFLVVDGSKKALKQAEKLLKGLAKKSKKKDKVVEKIKEEEESAVSGFGNLLGK